LIDTTSQEPDLVLHQQEQDQELDHQEPHHQEPHQQEQDQELHHLEDCHQAGHSKECWTGAANPLMVTADEEKRSLLSPIGTLIRQEICVYFLRRKCYCTA